MRDRFVIGSRGSKLALTQAEWVKRQLSSLHPSSQFEIEIIKTSGDVKTDPLSVIGGKGVFTKELEDALLDERIDIAVHSLKDLPTILPSQLQIAAICEREDARDALVLKDGEQATLQTLARGCVVGTSSPRRLAQLKHLRSDIVVNDLRGNVDTRLRKLDEGQYVALILASAGLRRLGLERRISNAISFDEMLPAVGQGALGVETRAGDEATSTVVGKLNHDATSLACTAERAMLRALGGGCQLPIAGHAQVNNGTLRLDGLVASVDGKNLVREHVIGNSSDAELLGAQLGDRLLRNGAQELLSK
jgi:hydroxymethylbilane synthase